METHAQPLGLVQCLSAGTQLQRSGRNAGITNGYFTLSQGSHNLDLITEINHNATSAHTRLRQDYNEVQQTLMLCTLEAQLDYVSSMRQAHEELQQCRIELGRAEEGAETETETEAETETHTPTN